jgi:WD40 repeat protein/serine/threonine protein kinase
VELGQLGDFRLLREIGRGGMGVVYEAEQISLSRRVALKVLPFAAALDSKQLQRFKNEAQAAAHLHHTNIVPVFGVGCERGVHYYVMQYIEGQTLAAIIRDLKLNVEGPMTNDEGMTNDQSPRAKDPASGANGQTDLRHSTLDILSSFGIGHSSFFRTVAQLGVQAAEALEHAHELGIVHRDIKPANLLLEWRASGMDAPVLWITDFGLAHCQSQAGLTLSGDLVGTLRYMSPEQALGKRGLVDHRADVYSLGVTLYELLTLEPAFSGTDREELLRQIAFEEPRPPWQWNKAIPRELETIVLKAMEKSPEGRFATAQELADDLRRFLDHKPIQAKRPTLLQRAFKWCRRNPLLSGALSAVAASLLLGTVVAWLLAVWALQEKNRADEKAAEAQKVAEDARRQAYTLAIRVMQQAWDSHNMAQLHRLLAETETYPDRGFEWYYWQRLGHLELQTLIGHRARITAVSWSPDGQRLATASGDATAKVWDGSSGRELFTLRGHMGGVLAVAWSPQGKRLATASADGTAKVWDGVTGQELLSLKRQASGLWSVCWSPDGKFLATAGDIAKAKVWDASSGQELLTLGRPPRITSVSWSPDGKYLATGSYQELTKLWDVWRNRELATLDTHENIVRWMSWSPDGKWIAIDNCVWEAASGRPLFRLQGHPGRFDAVSWSPDGKRLATGSDDGTANVWEVSSGRDLFTFGHTGPVWSVSWSPDGKKLATGTEDGTGRIWMAADRAEPVSFPSRRGPYDASVSWSPDSKLLTVGSPDGRVRVREVTTGRELCALGHTGELGPVSWSPDGKWIAIASGPDTEVWEAAGGREPLVLRGHTLAVQSLSWSPDSNQLATGSRDGTARIWEVTNARELLIFKGNANRIHCLAWSPDGKRLGTASDDGTLKVWKEADGREVLSLKGPLSRIVCLCWSPDGKRLATGSRDGTIKIWDASSGHEFSTFQGHTVRINSVSWSPDGKRLATGSDDGTAKVWEAASGRELLALKGHQDAVCSVSWSPDGKRLATESMDGTVKVWEAASAETVQEWVRKDRAGEERLARNAIGGPRAKGFIQDWLLLLPIPFLSGESGGQALDLRLPGEPGLKPKSGQRVRVRDKELVWRRYHSPEAVLDFNVAVGELKERYIGYAACYLQSDRPRNDLWLQVGSDDQAKVSINGRDVYQYRILRSLDDLETIGPVELKQGTNVLVFKVANEGGEWLGCVRLIDAAGQPAKDIRATIIPD